MSTRRRRKPGLPVRQAPPPTQPQCPPISTELESLMGRLDVLNVRLSQIAGKIRTEPPEAGAVAEPAQGNYTIGQLTCFCLDRVDLAQGTTGRIDDML